VYVFHHEDGQECLQSVDLRRGKVQWRREFEANYRGGVDPDQGPRCAPIAIGERILAFGAAGSLHCVRAEDGELLWTRDLYADYSGDEGFFGAGSCPLVVGDRVLVNVGGRRDAGIVTISLENGRTLWQTTTEAASYSAPIVVQREEKSLALFITRMNTVLMDPSSGKVLGTRPFGKRGPTVNAASPLLIGTSAFLTSSYGVGAALVRLDSPTLEPLWQNDTTLSSQYNTPVLHDGFLYGIHGREDHGPAELRCVEAQTGEVRWAERGFGVAHIILANGRLLLVKVDGTIVLAQATPEAYRELGRCSVTNRVTRALPALSNGRLLLRDNSTRDGRLMCFEL
jgi:outer membrane protein assembly factor BamB